MLSIDPWYVLWSIINVIVLFLVLKKFLYKPVLRMMDKRQNQIDTAIDTAEKNEAQALALKEKYENELQMSKNKAEEIIKESRIKAQNEYERILKEAKEEAENVILAAGKSIELQKKQEFEKMQEALVDIAIAAAVKATEESIDKEKSRKMLEQLVMKAGA
jgi:F-type H+-transporting ATPase subunit b